MILYVDIIDVCNLRCRTCPRGVRAFPNTPKKMSQAMFMKIVEKACYDGAYQVGLFNWIEPFLIRDLQDYARIVKSFGLRCEVASTLSVRRIDGLLDCLKSVDMLWVTTSGYTQSVYEINHAAGSVEYVMRHLKEISMAKKNGAIFTDVLLRFLMFDYNAHEEIPLRNLANELGFRFEVLLGSGHPIRTKVSPPDRGKDQSQMKGGLFGAIRRAAGGILFHTRDNSVSVPIISSLLASFSSERRNSVCPLIFEHIALDAAGDVYQCSAYGNLPPLRIGPYLDLTREEILLRRHNQPFCNTCDWKRRPATKHEQELIRQAVDVRLGRPIKERLAHLSTQGPPARFSKEGYLLPKDGNLPW